MCCKKKDLDPGSNAALAVQLPRRNGWSWPLHPFQLVAWFFIAYFGVVHFGILVPVMPAEWQIAGYITVGIFLALHCVIHLWSLTVNPADDNVIRKWKGLEPKRYDRTMQAHVIENSRCYICDTDVCASAKHCRLCNKCVSGFDHHCRWLNSCIGDKNYRLFIACLVTALIGALLILAVTLYITIMFFWKPSVLHFAQQDKYYLFAEVPGGAFISVVLLTTVLCVIAILLLGHLLCFHIYLTYYKMTTYEHILEKRRAIEEEEEEIRVLRELGYYEEKNLRYYAKKVRQFFAGCFGGCLAVLVAAFISGPRRCFKHACGGSCVVRFSRRFLCCGRKSGRVDTRYEDMERGADSSSDNSTREEAGTKPPRKGPLCVVTCCQINVVHPDPNGQGEGGSVPSAMAREGSLASGSSLGTSASDSDSIDSQPAARKSPSSETKVSKPYSAESQPDASYRKSPSSSGTSLSETDSGNPQPAAREGPSYLVRSGKPYSSPIDQKGWWSRFTCLCVRVCNNLTTYDYIMRGREKAKKSTPESSQQNLKGNKVAPVAMISRDQGLHESMENGYVPENGYHHGSYDPNSSDEDVRQMRRQYEDVLMEDEALSPRLTARSSGRHRPASSDRERQDSDREQPNIMKMPRQLPPIRPVANLVQDTTQVDATQGKKKKKPRATKRLSAEEQLRSTSVSSERKKPKRNGASKERKMEVAAIAANGTYTPRGYHIKQALPPITPPAPTPRNDVITPARSPSPYHSSSAESLQEIPLATIRGRQTPVILAGGSGNNSPSLSAQDPEKRSHSKRRKAKPKERRPRPLDVPPLELTQTVTDGEYSIRSDVTTGQSGRPLPVLHMATSNV